MSFDDQLEHIRRDKSARGAAMEVLREQKNANMVSDECGCGEHGVGEWNGLADFLNLSQYMVAMETNPLPTQVEHGKLVIPAPQSKDSLEIDVNKTTHRVYFDGENEQHVKIRIEPKEQK